jgi:dihydrofolate synthase / folylpolyglutamate synthase
LTYEQTLNYLYEKLPMYQRMGAYAFKKDLTNIIKLCDYLNNPQDKLKSIHIAGTNGKGSTSHILSAIYQSNGYKVGMYTSPHLVDFRERIKLDGTPCSKDFVINFTQQIKPIIEEIHPSFFEITVAMAFEYFAKNNVDIAIIETGLGGRLDSTNIIHPIASIITSIGFDHMDMLGNTIEQITNEKAGIIKDNTPVIIGKVNKIAKQVLKKVASEKNAPLVFYQKENQKTDLIGEHQQWNIGSALSCVESLKDILPTNKVKTKQALLNVSELSNFLGRWQIFYKNPLVIGDVGHNEQGFRLIANELSKYTKKIHFILGFVDDKDLSKIIPTLPMESSYSFVKPNIIRGMKSEKVREIFESYDIQGISFPDLKSAINQRFKSVSKNELIFVGGSNFIIADLLKLKENKQLPF